MLLGYVMTRGRGATDRLLIEVATTLRAEGRRLAGVVQHNREEVPGARCDMVLELLHSGQEVCISQRLGGGSRGCRLDSQGLAAAAGLAADGLRDLPELVILNRFGKSESDGQGFRGLIGEALAAGLPVLLGLSATNLVAFERFADGMGHQLAPDPAAVCDWCRAAMPGLAGGGPDHPLVHDPCRS